MAESHDLYELISSLIETVVFRSVAKQVRFDLICPTDLKIFTKKGQLSQIIVNLIDNAIDALNDVDDKWVEIKVLKKDSKIIISITDSGPGIPSELKDKVLLPFFTTKAVGKGSGMGLSVSLGIIQSMGGDLWLDKKSPHPKFVIELPI